MRKSIIQKTQTCAVCGTNSNIHTHEVFYGTANRKKSIEDKMIIYLCGAHHNLTSQGIHFDHNLDIHFKKIAQQKWEEIYGDRNKFIERYGKSYL